MLIYFALSWGSWLLLTGGASMRSDPRFMFIVLAAPVAPAMAGLLMTGLTAGKAGYRELPAARFDRQAYIPYGLTEEEIKIVEGK